MKPSARFLCLTTVLVAGAVLPSPAATAGVTREVTVEAVSEIWDDCPGLPYRSDTTATVRRTIRVGADGFDKYGEVTKITQVNTNLDTGRTLSFDLNLSYRDVRYVVNDDGTVTLYSQSSGLTLVRADGHPVEIDGAGSWAWTVTFDANGDEVAFELTREPGHSTTEGDTFCGAMGQFTS